MLRTELKIGLVLVASALIGCEGALEVRESQQAPQWDEVLHATAPLLPDEVGSGIIDRPPPTELYVDPGIAETQVDILPTSGAVRAQRERTIHEAGLSVTSYRRESDCRTWSPIPEHGRPYPPACEVRASRDGITVVYGEPVRGNGRWVVEAHVWNPGSLGGSIYFELARKGGEWAVTEMVSHISPVF